MITSSKPGISSKIARVGKSAAGFAAAIALTGLFAGAAQAVPVTQLAFKLSDSTPQLDAFTGWTNTGGFNEGTPAAQALINNGLDYKNGTLVDNWSNVLSVRVSFYTGGVEQAFVEFDGTGTTKNNFYTQANITSSSWTDTAGPANFFSIPGDATYSRHWFINNNYGGCGADTGHAVVIDAGSQPCNWEQSRSPLVGTDERAFLYSLASTEVNWNSASVGVADTFAVFMTTDQVVSVSEPGILTVLGLGLAGLGIANRRRRRG